LYLLEASVRTASADSVAVEFRRAHRTIESVRDDAPYAFDQGYKDPEEMEALSEMSEGLKNFAKRYNYAINDPELIRRYRMVEDGKRDVATRIAVAEEKAEARGREIGEARGREIGEARGREIGEARGREIGEARKNRENARAMRNAGIDVALIAQITGLDEAEINAL
jgi:predicted transposase YdaD